MRDRHDAPGGVWDAGRVGEGGGPWHHDGLPAAHRDLPEIPCVSQWHHRGHQKSKSSFPGLWLHDPRLADCVNVHTYQERPVCCHIFGTLQILLICLNMETNHIESIKITRANDKKSIKMHVQKVWVIQYIVIYWNCSMFVPCSKAAPCIAFTVDWLEYYSVESLMELSQLSAVKQVWFL